MINKFLNAALAGFMLSVSCLVNVANAGIITVHGAITALGNISELDIDGTANFNTSLGTLSLTEYSAQGLNFHQGLLTNVLAGVSTAGTASAPIVVSGSSLFPGVIARGGTQDGFVNVHAGVATFINDVTQFGLTASQNGPQYLTIWDKAGAIIGQLDWSPAADASFIGIDTGGVAIGMVAYGNDDLWNGAAYGVGGATIYSDNWVWNNASTVPEPSALAIFALGMIGLASRRFKKS